MPRKKPQQLAPLDPQVAAERLASGERVWVDLVDAANFYGVPPDTFLLALQNGELVSSRKPGKRGKAWDCFVLALDTLIEWAAKRSISPARMTVN
jgi:hypothetical protein